MKYSPQEAARLASESQQRADRRRAATHRREMRFIEHFRYPAYGAAAGLIIAALLIMLRYGFGVVTI